MSRVLLLLIVLLSGCAPSLESLYQPYRQKHEWVYRAERTGLKISYQNIIRVWSEPQAGNTSLVRVHIFPDSLDARVGARHTYRLDWSRTPPTITALTTQAGSGRLEPGLPLPDFTEASGQGKATYQAGRGDFAGRSFTYSWHYLPGPSPLERSADLELRSSLKLTDSNIRVTLKPEVGIGNAEWKTVYGVSVKFSLESFK